MQTSKKKVLIKQYLLYDICSESHPCKSLKNLRHTVRIHMQPKQVVQRDSNNESKSRKSIPTSNFIIYRKSYSV